MEYIYPIEEYKRFSHEINMDDISEEKLKELTQDGLYHEVNFMYQYGVPDEGRKDDNILKIVHIEKQTVPIILKNKIDMAWESLGFTIMQSIFYHIKNKIDPSLHKKLVAVRFKLLDPTSELVHKAWDEFTKYKGDQYTIRIDKGKDGKEKINLRQRKNLYNMLCLMEVEDAYE